MKSYIFMLIEISFLKKIFFIIFKYNTGVINWHKNKNKCDKQRDFWFTRWIRTERKQGETLRCANNSRLESLVKITLKVQIDQLKEKVGFTVIKGNESKCYSWHGAIGTIWFLINMDDNRKTWCPHM